MSSKLTLNNGWEFTKEFTKELLERTYDSDKLEEVRLPHSNCEMPYNYFDESIYQMTCGYRRKLWVPEEWKGKCVLLTFEGVAHYAEVFINGKKAMEHRCGYTAFTVDISSYLTYEEENLITVKVDSHETLNIPPFGRVIDYMTYGGIYREVTLEIKEKNYIEDVYVLTKGILNEEKMAEIELQLHELRENSYVKMYLHKVGSDECIDLGKENIENQTQKIVRILNNIELWSLEQPTLYEFIVELWEKERCMDVKKVRIGFREAVFKQDGFYLNGEKVKIVGLNRHQSYPYVGYAMPKAPQVNDANILKWELGLNAVRTSHYPQSHHFLNRCDEIGLLVFTEIPGWQFIGDEEWKDVACKNVEEMILQYRNHPSIMLWGVRINESPDDDEFYRRTNEIAHRLDKGRQTGGVRCIKGSHLFEDVYTYNDFVHTGKNQGLDDKAKVTSKESAPYLVSEFNGHMYPTKSFDWEEHRLEHTLRHARVIDAMMGKKDIAGAFGWCMFDYNTHKDFGSGDRICYHGVMDMFRNPKMAAALYKSQGEYEPFLELSTSMDIGEHPASCLGDIYAFTNCDSVKFYKNEEYMTEFHRDDNVLSNLKHPPILINDFIGEQLVEKEHYSREKSDLVKEILNAAAIYGMDKLPFSIKLKALKAMIKYRMKFLDAVELFNKYVGNWGKEVTSYRFEGIKDGKVVKTIYKEPTTKVVLNVEIDHQDLKEEDTYDVASVRIKACDQCGNVLSYYQEPITLKVDGEIRLIGPEIISLKGGMGGTYIKTTGKEGSGTLTIHGVGVEKTEKEFRVTITP